MGKSALTHIKRVMKGILCVGFSIQIMFGIVWMCSNFAHVQDFGAPESAFYGAIYFLTGECPQVMYLLQLAAGFACGYLFLQAVSPVDKWRAILRTLALMTFPFAMQNALAIQPYSFIGSLLLLLFYFVVRGALKLRVRIVAALGCALFVFCLSGAVDSADGERIWDYGWEASVASRLSWSTIMHDRQFWPQELTEYTEETWWETRYCPDNMVLLLDGIEKYAGEEGLKEWCLWMAGVSLEYRMPVIVRQLGWDVLGYGVTPLILPLQLEGEAYESYTPGNYGVMREHAPRLTKAYVDYGCWWFGVSMVLAVLAVIVRVVSFLGEGHRRKTERFRAPLAVGAISMALILILTMRGAGLMDYRWTVAINQLWLVWALVSVGRAEEN